MTMAVLASSAPRVEALALAGRVFNIQRFSIHDGPGIRTTVFLKGCPLRCSWCRNPESQKGGIEVSHSDALCDHCGRCVPACPENALSLCDGGVRIDRTGCNECGKCVEVCLPQALPQALRQIGEDLTVAQVFDEVKRDETYYRNSVGGVTCSGGEPLTQALFACCRQAAIRKRVFDDGRVKMANLVEALRKSWSGYEVLRQLMLSAPKYGNDDDYADAVAAEVQEKSTEVMESFTDHDGRPYWVNGTNAATIFGFSWVTDATPDGRFKGDMLADGTASPMLGTDTKGPTAVLKSASKVNTAKTYTHLLNQKLAPALVEGEKGKKLFRGYVRSWMDLGVTEVQFNLLDKETLLDAQVHPREHKDVIVRVAGYSAYFIDLSRGMQDSIIERTEHCCW